LRRKGRVNNNAEAGAAAWEAAASEAAGLDFPVAALRAVAEDIRAVAEDIRVVAEDIRVVAEADIRMIAAEDIRMVAVVIPAAGAVRLP
jgi:hypothetical protein